MKKNFTRSQWRLYVTTITVLLFTYLIIGNTKVFGQTTIATTTGLNNNDVAQTVTFNFQNTNSYPVVITDIEGILGLYGNNTIELWYKNSAISGAPGDISVANGWTQFTSTNINGISNTTTVTTQSFFSGISLTIPASSTYGIALSGYSSAGSIRITNMTGASTVSGGGCNIIMGTNVGYAGPSGPPAAPTQTPVAWLGKIRFISGTPCAGSPAIATISGPATACINKAFSLTATGYTVGTGISYKWQYFNTGTSAWTDILNATSGNSYTNTAGITASTQYRMVTTCATGSVQSISNTVTVGISAGLTTGTYTINNTAPSSSTNFISFNDAAAALSCGISGPVTINVAPGTGPYNEAVTFGQVPGTSPVNKIRLNGNGAILQFFTDVNQRAILSLRGVKYMTVDSLTIRSLTTTNYCDGILISDTTRYDSITHCFVDMRSIGATTSNTSGITISSYNNINLGYDSTSTSYCYIGYNHILGTNDAGGPNYGINYGNNFYANANNNADTNNIIAHNEVENFFYYGIFSYSNNGLKILNNDVHRKNKLSGLGGNFFGIYNYGGWNNVNSTPNNNQLGIQIVGNRIHDPASVVAATVSGGFWGIYSNNNWGGVNNNYNQGNTLIANNAIYNVNQAFNGICYGIIFGGNNNFNNTNNQDTTFVYHNTIDISNAISGTGSVMGLYCNNWYGVNNNNNDNTFVKNNMVTITGGTNGPKYGVYINDFNNNINTNYNATRNNIYLNSTQPGDQIYYRRNNVNYATIAVLQAAFPLLETGSLTVNPQYMSPSTGDFTPTNFALNGNGVNLQSVVPKDILGRQRTITPTPGAFELATDAKVTALVAPLGTYCSSVKEVKVSIANSGYNVINTVQIHWTLNGVAQPIVTYNTPLQGVNGSPNTAVVSLGNGLFLPNTPVTIKAWTYMPNGQMDGIPENDTLTITTQSSTSVPVDLGPDETICTGNSKTLDAGYPGSVYLWDNQAINTQTRTITAAGTYYVRVTALDGCIGVDTFVLSLRPLPVVDLGPDVEICLGSTYTFDAGHPGSTYLWDDGTTTQTRTVDTAGYYEAQVTDIYGCMGFDNVEVGMKDIPGADGINATHADSGTYTFYPLNPVYSISYTWNFGDGSPEVTGYFVQHTYTTLGIYNVTLHLEGECTGLIIDKARTVDVFSVQGGNGGTSVIDLKNQNDLLLYPNPSADWVMIDNKSAHAMKNITAYNVLGQKVYEAKADSSNKHKIDISGLASGVYSVRIETADGSLIRKFEVLR